MSHENNERQRMMDSNSGDERDGVVVVVDDPAMTRGYVLAVQGAQTEREVKETVVSHLLTIDRRAGWEVWNAVEEGTQDVPDVVRRRWAARRPAAVVQSIAPFITLVPASASALAGLTVLSADARCPA